MSTLVICVCLLKDFISITFIATICNNLDLNQCIKAIYFWLENLFCSSCHLLLGFGRGESGSVMSFVEGIRLSGGGWL